MKSGNSKLAAYVALQSVVEHSFTDALYSSMMKTSHQVLPHHLLRVKPVISAALLFHSFTQPARVDAEDGRVGRVDEVCSSFATRVISSSASLRSVMSCPTPITPTTLPTRRAASWR